MVAGGEQTLPAVGTFIRRRNALTKRLIRVLLVPLVGRLAFLLLRLRGREESIAVSIREGRVVKQAGANVIVREMFPGREILKQGGQRLATGSEQELSLKLYVFCTHLETLEILLVNRGDRGLLLDEAIPSGFKGEDMI